MSTPNKLTLLRIIMIPAFIAVFYIDFAYNLYVAAALFVLAFITDILDGYLARKHNDISNFGKLLDPIADKMLVASALIMLTGRDMISPIVAIIILCREFIISGIRSFAAAKGKVMPAGIWGKLKTVFQCIAITAMLLGNIGFKEIGIPFDTIMVVIATALTVWSGIDYIFANRDLFKKVVTEDKE